MCPPTPSSKAYIYIYVFRLSFGSIVYNNLQYIILYVTDQLPMLSCDLLEVLLEQGFVHILVQMMPLL
jgi:hypothetical protein